ncbi:hypothetical protein ANI_1_936034 [Paecilomyces variotii No. 5]|uniref:Xylanolytic transcriptional activator regulatory domain-containing protein n=1 Tax=Byssochlamys spectabilis (strain No. 5 / NBRC 109023) TaxID=1356009 RepID=V5HVZ8_BYSSN|nr:hypothetical protein ANI_1_936034 [Paecilomyces variotii No. 5]
MSAPHGSFKVIVIGGGPVGLVAAHALFLAGIDFVVLERRPAIVEDKGASLIVHPHSLRVLHQFGILEALLSRAAELYHHLSFTADGYVFNEGNRYIRIRENHGHGPVAFHRAELVEILYNGLAAIAKRKVLTDKKVVNIQTTSNGVTVTCADGSTFHGSMVIGADGVYSKTREIMRDLALKEDPMRPWDPQYPYTATYQLLYGSFPSPSPSGQGYDIQSKGKAIMYFSGPERGWFFLYKRLPRQTRGRTDYTHQDIEHVAQEFAEYPLTRSVKVKDVWPRMLGAGLTNLDEGIVNNWSFGRIVLVGDACHKMTTHLGLGFNHGIQDVVLLCNSLQKAIRADRSGNPDANTLSGVFERYAAVRKSPVCSLKGDVLKSGLETRMHAWHNIWYYILSRYLTVPRVVEDLFMRYVMVPEFRKGQVLDYVPKEEPMKGKISWIYPMNSRVKGDGLTKTTIMMQSTLFALVTGCSSGIGKELAVAFAARGVTVLATARRAESLNELRSKHENIEAFSLELADGESIERLKDAIIKRTGGHLDFLINNAGTHYAATAMDLDIQEVMALFQINVFAVMRICQAFVPLLRRSPRARIVQIGSVTRGIPVVWQGAYNASKAALSQYSRTLRLEMKPLGIEVIEIITGFVRSNILHHGLHAPEGSLYLPILGVVEDIKYRGNANGMPPDLYAASVVKRLMRPQVSPEIWEGGMAHYLRVLIAILPLQLLTRVGVGEAGMEKRGGVVNSNKPREDGSIPQAPNLVLTQGRSLTPVEYASNEPSSVSGVAPEEASSTPSNASCLNFPSDQEEYLFFDIAQDANPIFSKERFLHRYRSSLCSQDLICTMAVIAAKLTQFSSTNDRLRLDAGLDSLLSSSLLEDDLVGNAPSLDQFRKAYLLAFYEFHQFPGHQSWLRIGRVTRMAYHIGLDRLDHIRVLYPEWTTVSNADIQEWRSLWWCLYRLDTYSNLSAGTPYLIDDSVINTSFNLGHNQDPFEGICLPPNSEGLSKLLPAILSETETLLTNVHNIIIAIIRQAGLVVRMHLLRWKDGIVAQVTNVERQLATLRLALPLGWLNPRRNAFSDERPADHHARLITIFLLRMAQLLLSLVDCGQQQADDWLASWQRVLETCQDIASLAEQWDSAFCLTVDPAITFTIFTALIFLDLHRKSGMSDDNLRSKIDHDITVLHLQLKHFGDIWTQSRLLTLSFESFVESVSGQLSHEQIVLILSRFEAPLHPRWLQFLSSARSVLEACQP